MDNNASVIVKSFYYHGFNYNATLASRIQITTVITEGMFFCIDPEAHNDINRAAGTPPTGTDYGPMGIRPEVNGGSVTSLGNESWSVARVATRPATAILPLFAGVVINRRSPRKWGSQSYGAGPQYLDLVTGGEVVLCRLNGTFTLGQEIMLEDGSFFGVPSTAIDVTSTVNQTTVNTALATAQTRRRITVGQCLSLGASAGVFTGAELVPCRIYNQANAS